MNSQAPTAANVQTELRRRHRSAVTVVAAFFALTLVLVAVAFFALKAITRTGDPRLPMYLWIVILTLGLGAFVLRRTRFAAMRLQDTAALRGISGLLQTLQGTTVQIATMAGAIALLGFIIAIHTGNEFDMLRAGGVALIVLIYCFPFRGGWERVVHGITRTGDANDTAGSGRTG